MFDMCGLFGFAFIITLGIVKMVSVGKSNPGVTKTIFRSVFKR